MNFCTFCGSIVGLMLPLSVVMAAFDDTNGRNARDVIDEELKHLPEALHQLRDSILAQQNDERNLFLGDLFDDQAEGEEKGLGQRCGNRYPCQQGLDCVSRSGGASWKICLPITCVEQATKAFNNPQPGSGTSVLEEFVGNVLSGAGLSPRLMFDNEIPVEIINQTTVNKGENVMKDKNHKHYLNRDVTEAIKLSLINEDRRNPMVGLHETVLNCFQPFFDGFSLGGNGEDAPIEHDNMQTTTSAKHDNSTRALQQDLTVIIFNGVFVEVSALLQIYYGWSTTRVDDGDGVMRDIQVQDVCFGAGPSAGGGVGYNLQIWWNGPSTIRRRLQDLLPKRNYELQPLPYLMTDIDVALGAGFGLSWSTLVFLLINRFFIRFYIGAGGGLACSLCLVYLDTGVA